MFELTKFEVIKFSKIAWICSKLFFLVRRIEIHNSSKLRMRCKFMTYL